MDNNSRNSKEKTKRRKFGIHLTSVEIFYKYIFPEIKDLIENYLWVDLYAGEGNLILPILNEIPYDKRESFFRGHIFLFDIQKDMVQKCIYNAEEYGIPKQIAENNIKKRDNLGSFPQILKRKKFPIFHITNPPYLYLGYIRKHYETQKFLQYFKKENKGYQDLYQIAMINDLRSDVENLIYVIPTNFLYGASVSNKFRLDFLKYYNILKMIIFETKIFEHTGSNICIGFFKKKKVPQDEFQTFTGLKTKKQNDILKMVYNLNPKYKYRAGSKFDEFLESYKAVNPLIVKYYLLKEEVSQNKGNFEIEVIDANQYKSNQYVKLNIKVNEKLKRIIESNILYVRTVDTGSYNGRAGLGQVNEDFDVHAIYVSHKTYRTHPIQIFLEPIISTDNQLLLRNYFNFILEQFRLKLDSEFLTTYKYSNAEYTRKYLGLNQTRKLIETFPYRKLTSEKKQDLKSLITSKDFKRILDFLKSI